MSLGWVQSWARNRFLIFFGLIQALMRPKATIIPSLQNILVETAKAESLEFFPKIHHNLGHWTIVISASRCGWKKKSSGPADYSFSVLFSWPKKKKKNPKWTHGNQRLQQFFPDWMRTSFVTHCCCWVKSRGWSPLPVDTRDRPSCRGTSLCANGTYRAAPFLAVTKETNLTLGTQTIGSLRKWPGKDSSHGLCFSPASSQNGEAMTLLDFPSFWLGHLVRLSVLDQIM